MARLPKFNTVDKKIAKIGLVDCKKWSVRAFYLTTYCSSLLGLAPEAPKVYHYRAVLPFRLEYSLRKICIQGPVSFQFNQFDYFIKFYLVV